MSSSNKDIKYQNMSTVSLDAKTISWVNICKGTHLPEMTVQPKFIKVKTIIKCKTDGCNSVCKNEFEERDKECSKCFRYFYSL